MSTQESVLKVRSAPCMVKTLDLCVYTLKLLALWTIYGTQLLPDASDVNSSKRSVRIQFIQHVLRLTNTYNKWHNTFKQAPACVKILRPHSTVCCCTSGLQCEGMTRKIKLAHSKQEIKHHLSIMRTSFPWLPFLNVHQEEQIRPSGS